MEHSNQMEEQEFLSPNLFFLGIFAKKTPILRKGVETKKCQFGTGVRLPRIEGMSPLKSIATLNKFNPAVVVAGKIYQALLEMVGGTRKFADPASFVTLKKPEDTETKIIIFCNRRFDFQGNLPTEIGVKTERKTGNPNGSVAPGTMILNDGDGFNIAWEGKKWTITNIEGFCHMIELKERVIKPTKPLKPKSVNITDNRKHIKPPKVVNKVNLSEPKEKLESGEDFENHSDGATYTLGEVLKNSKITLAPN